MTEVRSAPRSVRNQNSLRWITKAMQQHWNSTFGFTLNAKGRVENCTHTMMQLCETLYTHGQRLGREHISCAAHFCVQETKRMRKQRVLKREKRLRVCVCVCVCVCVTLTLKEFWFFLCNDLINKGNFFPK